MMQRRTIAARDLHPSTAMPAARAANRSSTRSNPMSNRAARFRTATRTVFILLGLVAPIAVVRPARAQQLVLRNASLVDVATGNIQRNATVVIDAGRIQAIGTNTTGLPSGARVIDLGGRYLMPGLMDAHVHIATMDQARRALESGVTTARSMGVSSYADVGLNRLEEQGVPGIPEIIPAGYHIRPQPAEPFFFDHPDLSKYMGGKVRGPEAIRAMVRAMADRGIAWVKTTVTERAGLPDTDPRKQIYGDEEMQAMVEEATAHGLPVAAHAHGDAGARAAVQAGVRSIEHGTFLSNETLTLMKEKGTYLVPTMAIVLDLALPGGDYDDAFLQIRGRAMLPRIREVARNARIMGIPIVAGTDTGYGPESITRVCHELEEFIGIGMTPLQAIQAATTVPARLFGIEDRTGRIAQGFEADLIILDRNPVEDIRATQDVLMVINNGRIAVARGDWAATQTSNQP
jgi:imidazolonepropionase-like amidohydrolase